MSCFNRAHFPQESPVTLPPYDSTVSADGLDTSAAMQQMTGLVRAQHRLILEMRKRIQRLESQMSLLSYSGEWTRILDHIVSAAQSEGPESIVLLLKTHLDTPDLVWRACESIGIIGKGSCTSVKRLFMSGACEAVLEGLRNYPEEAAVQKFGCSAVWVLAQDEACLELLIQGGACKAVVDTLHDHMNDKAVLIPGCVALGYLAAYKGAIGKLGGAGACEALAEVIKTYLDDDQELTQVSLLTMAAIIEGSEENARRLTGVKAEDHVLKAMVVYPFDLDLQRGACHVLCGLTLDDRQITILGDLGACALLAKALHCFHFDLSLQEYGVRTAVALLGDGVNAERFVQVGLPDLVISAISAFPRQRTLQRLCFNVIRRMVESSEEARSQMESNNKGCQAVVTALHNFPGDKEILQDGWQTIALLTETISPSEGISPAGLGSSPRDPSCQVKAADK
jgi:hypothetical protein